MKRVTMAEVAAMANVSKSTVSQYINNRFEYMSEETKLRIENAIETLQYRPNYVAKSLKQKQTSTIGVIVANILHTFSTQVIRSIEDFCRESGFHVIVCNADDNPEAEKNYIDMLRAKQVDGLIVFPTGGNMELYESMVEEKYPLVFVDRIVKDVRVDTVLLDNERASELAVDHLISKGYRRIGMITTSLHRNITPRMERINGFKKSLNKHSLPVRESDYAGVEISDMKQTLQRMFAQSDPPEALIAGNDLTMMEILKFAKAANLAIPDQLALVGIDDVSFSEIYDPPLTTVRQPAFEIGKRAGELLLRQVKEGRQDEGRVYRFTPELIIRSST
ncbi:substrate-binding domain-containing protein [Brevibacillus humidisoli]|uniref:substrate-binding domain-containing protein n=1 Tax=Brevibacillus humidisoli TaxID=2895522 RepID=UPI001E598E3F|nr:substrate-binding domain-containing protein [Brevibacillus humidisoli]UFJ40297.1 substrate-binding domain-containing protein [Brevibacillus humidisoli]